MVAQRKALFYHIGHEFPDLSNAWPLGGKPEISQEGSAALHRDAQGKSQADMGLWVSSKAALCRRRG